MPKQVRFARAYWDGQKRYRKGVHIVDDNLELPSTATVLSEVVEAEPEPTGPKAKARTSKGEQLSLKGL